MELARQFDSLSIVESLKRAESIVVAEEEEE